MPLGNMVLRGALFTYYGMVVKVNPNDDLLCFCVPHRAARML